MIVDVAASVIFFVFFFKQKTAYEVRISDWSSDVCSSDLYVVYGPLANGATSLMFEGVPNYPDSSRFWDMVERHKVNIFYTAPTAIRALAREGEGPVKTHDRSSIRILGTVGEPINPTAWLWYSKVVGDQRSPLVAHRWQTETGRD